MGEFDRSSDAQPVKQNRQYVIAIGLAAILTCVLGYHFLSGSPQAASASATSDSAMANGAMGTSLTPEKAATMLRDDPTAKLLQDDAPRDRAFDALPRNPFAMSMGFYTSLVHAPAPAPAAPVMVKPQAPAPVIAPLKKDDYRLGSIFRQGDHFSAIINGQIVRAGMAVGEARIVDIRDDRVILQGNDTPTGPTTELLLTPGIEPRIK